MFKNHDSCSIFNVLNRTCLKQACGSLLQAMGEGEPSCRRELEQHQEEEEEEIIRQAYKYREKISSCGLLPCGPNTQKSGSCSMYPTPTPHHHQPPSHKQNDRLHLHWSAISCSSCTFGNYNHAPQLDGNWFSTR